MSEYLKQTVVKTDEVVGESVAKAVDAMKDGDVVLLENVRFDAGETKNAPEFIDKLYESVKPDLYVNDAFGTAHRAHATTVGLTTKVPYLIPLSPHS